MSGNGKGSGRAGAAIVSGLMFTLIYVFWTGATDLYDISIFAILALGTCAIFVRGGIFPRPGLKRIAYAAAYIPYMVVEIVKANLDVASRVIKPTIPLNPGIVAVDTKLSTPIGRTVLANSITLTPGTLSVEIKGNRLYIHWIDVQGRGGEEEAKIIVAGFEKYLEVIFG
ncbi:MAG: Na+/H+ antiporter subunit E [Bacteroidales bacterium]|nr:Na+/H+ antiporter subunit E [Candidatus Latescibacterota bacterium]